MKKCLPNYFGNHFSVEGNFGYNGIFGSEGSCSWCPNSQATDTLCFLTCLTKVFQRCLGEAFLLTAGRPRFGSVAVWGWNGSFSVPVFGSGGSSAQRVFFCVSVQFNRKGRFRFRFRFLENGSGGSGSGFGSWKTVPAVPVPLSVSEKAVPVSGSCATLLTVEAFFLQLSFFAYSLFRCSETRSPIVSKKAAAVSKKAPTVSKKAQAESKRAPHHKCK